MVKKNAKNMAQVPSRGSRECGVFQRALTQILQPHEKENVISLILAV